MGDVSTAVIHGLQEIVMNLTHAWGDVERISLTYLSKGLFSKAEQARDGIDMELDGCSFARTGGTVRKSF